MESLFSRYDKIDTLYNAGIKMVEDGFFLIYYYDVDKWLLENNLTTQNLITKGMTVGISTST